MLRQGSIVLAWIADPQGRNPKARPLVVITPTIEILTSKQLVAVAITGHFSQPLAADEVALPYHPGGRASTGLRKPCVAKCSWLVTIQADDVLEPKGFLATQRLLAVLKAVGDLDQETKP
jgi:mRNA-degrading endonuclease toxin of MazEF toxin-antitoxin module